MDIKTLKFKYLFIICLVVFVVLIYRGSSLYGKIITVIFENERITFSEKVETFIVMLDGEERVANVLFSHEEVKSYVIKRDVYSQNLMMSVFDNFILDKNIYNNIWIADENGMIYFDMRHQVTGTSVKNRTYFEESKKNPKPKISGEIIVSKSSGVKIVPIVQGIYVNGQYKGLIAISINWEYLHEKYIAPLENRKERGYFAIYNLNLNKSMYPENSKIEAYIQSGNYKKTNVYENYLIFSKESNGLSFVYFLDKSLVYSRVAIQTTLLIIFVIITIIVLSYMYGLYIEKKLRGEV